MKKITWIIVLHSCLLVPFIAGAQQVKKGKFADISLSTNLGQHAVSAAAFQMHYLGSKQKFALGYGVRYTGSFGRNTNFLTAPAKLTKSIGNMDTIGFNRHSVNSINVAIYLQYLLTNKLVFEFNIDAIGFSFGSSQIANYSSSKKTSESDMQTANVSNFNVLLVDDNDIGSINSEFLLRYQVRPKVSLKAGVSYIYIEYTTNNRLYLDNDRFRNKSVQALFGVNLRLD